MSITSAVANITPDSNVTVSIHSPLKLRKTLDTPDGRVPNPHFGRVTKRTEGMIVRLFPTTDGYRESVKSGLEAEGKNPEDFTISPRKWGVRLPNLPIVQHNGNDYLEAIVLESGTTSYYLDGEVIDLDDVQGYTKPKSSPAQGGLTNKVILRTFAESSISQLTIDGIIIL